MDRTLEQPMAKRAVVRLNIPFRSSPEERPGEGGLYAASAVKHRYMEALGQEFEAAVPLLSEYSVPAVCVVGGSPSVVRPDDLAGLLRRVRAGLNLERGFELSMQALPQTVGTPCMDGMKAGGVNCVRLQAASAVDGELDRVGCGYRREHVDNAMRFISRFSIRSVCFDAMYGLPGQDERSLRESLKFWTFYEPDCIELARWEAATAPGGPQGPAVPADDLLALACERLEDAGYRRYADTCADPGLYVGATAHFALPGKERASVCGALEGLDVFSFGLGATSCMADVVCETTSDLGLYMDNAASYDKIVARAERLDEAGVRRWREGLGSLSAL